MKLLFVCSEYYGSRDPAARCIEYLRTELKKNNVQSDVLTYAWKGEQESSVEDELGRIFLAQTWYRFSRLKRGANGKIQMSLSKLFLAVLTRLFAFALEGKYYSQRGLPMKATRQMGKKLRQLCGQDHYDWIVSVAYPFANHKTVLEWRPKEMPVALYNLDPYYNNGTYASSAKADRLHEEIQVYEQAECVFCTPEQWPDYHKDAFKNIINKIQTLPYPNLVPPKVLDKCDIRFDPQKINCIYLGTIYGNIRKPDALFQLFEQAIKQEPDLQLYIIGKKFGRDAERYLVEYSEKLPQNIICLDPIPAEQTMDALLHADILVNLGNCVANQMPSKIMEYISTGKPILNISMISNCSTLPVLGRYPLHFQCSREDCVQGKTIDQALAFCREHAGRRIAWDEVQEIYPDMQVGTVAEQFLQGLQA